MTDKESKIITHIGKKYQPVFLLLTDVSKNLLKRISEYDKAGNPKIDILYEKFRLFNETLDKVSYLMAYEISICCKKEGINTKSTLIPAQCWHCGKIYPMRVRLAKKNVNDIFYGEASPIRKAKQKKYCSRECANQAFYMRKNSIKKPDAPRVCIVCGTPLPPDASLKKVTCSDKCRQQKRRKSISVQSREGSA